MADASTVRQNYAVGMQAVAKLVLQLNAAMESLNNLYLGDGLSGTFQDSELANAAGTKHLAAADVGTITFNLNTVRAALTTDVIQIMAKAVGNV